MDEIIMLQAKLDQIKSVKNINADIKKLQGQLNQIKVQAKVDPNAAKELAKELEKIIDQKAAYTDLEQLNKIQLSMSGQGKVDEEINKFKNLGLTEEETAQQVKNLTDAHTELKRVMRSTEFDSIESKNDIFPHYNLDEQTKLSTDIQNWLSKNSNASKEAKESLNAYYRELSSGAVSADRLNYIEQELANIDTVQGRLGKLGKTLKDQFSQAAQSFSSWLSLSSGIIFLINQLRRMPQEVLKVNSAMTELNQVSSASASDIKKYFDAAAESAKDLGSSVSDVITATADFSKLGFSLSESGELAKAATLYKNVGDGIDISGAGSSIVNAMKAFAIEAEDAIGIVDKFNQVENDFAISSNDIGNALKRSASSLAAAGNTMSESLGLIAAANTVVQDADIAGDVLRTLSLRISSTADELKALGEDTEYACETLSDYQDLILETTHNRVDIVGDSGNYKSAFQILREISEVWEEMNSVEQSSLMNALFGTGQSNIGASILENFDIAEEAMKAAGNAAGSALREQETYEQGIQYSLDRLEASFQTFANHVLDSALLKGFVDFGNGALNVIDAITSKLSSFGTIGLGAGIFAGVKNIGKAV